MKCPVLKTTCAQYDFLQMEEIFDNQVWILESESTIFCKEYSQILAMTSKFSENHVHTKCHLAVFITV